MRICGDKGGLEKLRGAKERPQSYRVPREGVGAPLLAVDDADGDPALQALLAQRLDRSHRRASGGDDVLHETGERAGLEGALQALLGAVALGLLAHDDEGEARGERRRGDKRDRAELRAGEERRVRLVLAHGVGDPPPERAQEVRPRLEAVLVQVVAGAAARAQDEVALEVRRLPERAGELRVAHVRAARSASRPSASSRSDSGEPSGSETIEPSS